VARSQPTLTRLRAGFDRLLEAIVIMLMIALAVEVILGVSFRTFGRALVWYDEIASVTLAWLTYYGAAYAALKGAHIGVPEIIRLMPPWLRVPLVILAEAIVLVFFAVLAWTGWYVIDVLATDTLVSLPSVSVQYTQSVIPISAVLFIVAELLRLPQLLAEARKRRTNLGETEEIGI
jgi:TRAP-type C4-dicarboxylate transport system permease small subunit